MPNFTQIGHNWYFRRQKERPYQKDFVAKFSDIFSVFFELRIDDHRRGTPLHTITPNKDN